MHFEEHNAFFLGEGAIFSLFLFMIMQNHNK